MGAWSCLHQALIFTPGVGLASGAEGGGVLEVPCLAGDTVDVSFPNFIFNLSFSARWALRKWLAMHALRAPKDAVRSWLAAALGFAIAGARGNLLEA
jgi:hypothetical protein